MAYGDHGDFGASQFAGPNQSQAVTAGGAYGSGSPRKKQSAEQTLRTVTVGHLMRETSHVNDGTFTVDGVEVNAVAVVGRITQLDDTSSKQTALDVEEHGWTVKVVLFKDDSSTQQPDWHVGSYVKVVGNLRSQQQKVMVHAYSIRTVRDHNQTTFHQLQCILQHVQLTQGAPPPAVGNTLQAGDAPKASTTGSSQPAAGAPSAASTGVSSLNDAVLAFYRAPENAAKESGVRLEEAQSALRAQGVPVTRQALATACEELCNEGLMYTTMDETTFRCI